MFPAESHGEGDNGARQHAAMPDPIVAADGSGRNPRKIDADLPRPFAKSKYHVNTGREDLQDHWRRPLVSRGEDQRDEDREEAGIADEKLDQAEPPDFHYYGCSFLIERLRERWRDARFGGRCGRPARENSGERSKAPAGYTSAKKG